MPPPLSKGLMPPLGGGAQDAFERVRLVGSGIEGRVNKENIGKPPNIFIALFIRIGTLMKETGDFLGIV